MNETVPMQAPNEHVTRAKTRVRVFTPSGIIEGDYPHAPGARLSDSLRNSASGERYMLLTDVSIRGLQGESLAGELGSAPFILLNSSHASVLIPIGEALTMTPPADQ